MRLPDTNLPWPVPMAVVAMMAEREQGPKGGPALEAYICPAGVPTIGWGETDGVKMGDTCTVDKADALLLEALIERSEQVRSVCTTHPTKNQLGAMTSLQYNVGQATFVKSTVLRCHNKGDFEGASRAFGLFNKAKVKGTDGVVRLSVLSGLTLRRAMESAIYLTPEPGMAPLPMPQAVQPEASLVKSPIAQTSVGVGTLGAAVGVLDMFDVNKLGMLTTMIDTVRHYADQLNVRPLTALSCLLVGGGAVALYQRWKQRVQGWA